MDALQSLAGHTKLGIDVCSNQYIRSCWYIPETSRPGFLKGSDGKTANQANPITEMGADGADLLGWALGTTSACGAAGLIYDVVARSLP